eukprot:TRINITY_DN26862_c0_g1_i1.p1 TRINITY_DN26862_c0_g1~~TRINITY_DN26862_c0_g1_i1.p1  ORF type:complete len:249 (+),score=65.36 TRINITY_DN26862_c0_g1_i1:89-835(+)
MIRRPPRSTQGVSSAASDVYKRQKLVNTAKKQFARAFKKISNNQARRRLNRWREICHNIYREQTNLENNNLEKQNEKQGERIHENEVLKNNNIEKIEEWGRRGEKQDSTLIFKNMMIWYNRRAKEAFRKWKVYSIARKAADIFLKRLSGKNEANNYRSAWSKWRSFVFFNHLKNINEDLAKRATKHETFLRISALNIAGAEEEYRKMYNELNKLKKENAIDNDKIEGCLLYTSPSPRDLSTSRMPSSA